MPSNVTIDFNANLARFTSSIDKATNDLSRFQSNSQRISNQIKSAFAGLGVGISVAGFGAFIKSSIDALDRLNDLNKVTGISVEQLSGLSLAAQQTGTDLDGVASVISRFSVNLGKEGAKFRELGITATDPLEAFRQLADVFVSIQDPAQRAALAATALGKGFQSAIPLLAEGGARIGELVERGQRLSGVTREAAEQADKFNDQMSELQAVAGQAGIRIADNLLPSLNDTAAAMKRLADEGNPLLALLRGFAGLGKLPFDLAIAPTDFSITGRVKELRIELGELQRSLEKKPLGTGLLGELVFGTNAELTKRIEVTKNQIASLEKFQDQIRPKKPDTDQTKTPTNNAAVRRFIDGDGKSADDKAARDRKKIFDENRSQEDRNRGVDFDIEAAEIDREADAFIKQRDRIADLRKEFISLIDPVEAYRVKLNEIDEAEQAGALSADQANAARFKINDAIDAQLEFGKALEQTRTIADEVGDALSRGLEQSIISGRKFSDVVKIIGLDLAKLALQKAFTQNVSSSIGGGGFFSSILSGIGSLFGGGGGFGGAATVAVANGGVFDGGAGLSAFSGSVVSRPTLFPFAAGVGLMGEAGPEAILPLKRGRDGRLGVTVDSTERSSAPTINVYITTNANGDSSVSGNGTADANRLAKQLEAAVRAVLVNESRSGGLLST